MGYGGMGTPIKSPLQKKLRGDEGLDDDVHITGVNRAGPSQGVTLSAIEQLLDKKLNPLHQFLEQIRLDLTAFKESVRTELEDMGLRITSNEQMMTDTVARVTELEQKMGKIQVGKETPCGREVDSSRFLSMVVGNILEASALDRASGIALPGPSDVYSKGPFSNLLFVKCQSEAHRDRFIQSICDAAKHTKASNGGEPLPAQLFAKVDLPFNIRTVEGALYAMKRMLISWNFNPACIKYDIHTCILTVAGREIFKVYVQNFSLSFDWCDGEWQTWDALQQSTELAEITSKALTRLEKAKARASNKGKGKGPSRGHGGVWTTWEMFHPVAGRQQRTVLIKAVVVSAI